MLRVYVIFKADMNNPLSTIQVRSFVCVLLLDILVIGVFITCIYEDFTDSNLLFLGPPNIKTVKSIVTAIIIIFNDLLINFTLLYLVVSKFYSIMNDLDTNTTLTYQHFINVNNSSTNTDHDNISDCSVNSMAIQSDSNSNRNGYMSVQTEIVNLMTKLSLITIVSVIFSQFWNFGILYLSIIQIENTNHQYSSMYFNILLISLYMFRAIAAITDCLVIYFTYQFNQKTYFACCSLCHNHLRYHCIKCIIQRNLNNRIRVDIKQDQSHHQRHFLSNEQ